MRSMQRPTRNMLHPLSSSLTVELRMPNYTLLRRKMVALCGYRLSYEVSRGFH
jgi:hypothetical protein